jgi:hypothetical protein
MYPAVAAIVVSHSMWPWKKQRGCGVDQLKVRRLAVGRLAFDSRLATPGRFFPLSRAAMRRSRGNLANDDG